MLSIFANKLGALPSDLQAIAFENAPYLAYITDADAKYIAGTRLYKDFLQSFAINKACGLDFVFLEQLDLVVNLRALVAKLEINQDSSFTFSLECEESIKNVKSFLSNSSLISYSNDSLLKLNNKLEFEVKVSCLSFDRKKYFIFYLNIAPAGKASKTIIEQQLKLPAPQDEPLMSKEEVSDNNFALSSSALDKKLEVKIAESQKMQAVGQLAGGIAHDFNNVLTAILMSADILLNNHRRSDPSFPDLVNIKQNAGRAAALVRQLLAFSRRQTLRPQLVNLTDILSDWQLMLSRYVGSEISLKLEYAQDLWPIFADIDEFGRVIVNLAVNAADAMPQGGEIRISTRNYQAREILALPYKELHPIDYIELEISDTGTGIDAEIMERIFEPFFTTKPVGEGTGLGLSMVYGIVKQTGGNIYCESVKGKGTRFRIFLPAAHDKDISNDKVAANSDQSKEESDICVSKLEPAGASNLKVVTDVSGSARILLVEDEEIVRKGSARILAARGYEILEASSGLEALKILEEQDWKVDLIISDVVMPDMDGPSLLKNLIARSISIPFLFVSGYAEEAFAKHLPENASFSFLAKPFSLKQLASTVKELLLTAAK